MAIQNELFPEKYKTNLTVDLLYSGGFSHTYSYNKYGTAHCVLKGSQVEFSKILYNYFFLNTILFFSFNEDS